MSTIREIDETPLGDLIRINGNGPIVCGEHARLAQIIAEGDIIQFYVMVDGNKQYMERITTPEEIDDWFKSRVETPAPPVTGEQLPNPSPEIAARFQKNAGIKKS